MNIKDIKNAIKNIPDFPKKGVNFKDITPIFYDTKMIKYIINKIAQYAKKLKIDLIVAPESRGYLIGLPLAIALKKPFIIIRKKGKLPREIVSVDYESEYGSNTFEIHSDAIMPNQRVLIIDDLIATGGTSLAIESLVKKLQGIVTGHAYLIELKDLDGKQKLTGDFFSLIQY